MMIKIKQYDVWLADLNPRYGTESGKSRPVVIIQTDLLNEVGHPSTIVCPLTSNIIEDPGADLLRVHLSPREAGTVKPSDILIDQVRSIDNKRLLEKLGKLDKASVKLLRENLGIVFGLQVAME